MNESDRFWSKVNKTSGSLSVHCPELGPCWPWKAGVCTGGYGVFMRANKKSVRAHHFALETKIGSVGDLFALHRCHNRICCNPGHLYAGTHSQNMKDAAKIGTLAILNLGPEQRPRGNAHWTRAKPELVLRGDRHPSRRPVSGMSVYDAADACGVTHRSILNWIINGSVVAVKEGRRWSVDSGSLPMRVPRARNGHVKT